MTPTSAIPALQAARRAEKPRRDVWLDGVRVGSVSEAHLPLLHEAGSDFGFDEAGVTICIAPAEREERLARWHRRWHAEGAIVGWRDERYALSAIEGPRAGQALVGIERAASRFWGSLTFGAHATGYVRGADGRPTALWIAQRSLDKPTEPGLFDNLVGGGVPLGQTPAQALVREAWEEAGLDPLLAARARAGPVLSLARDIPEGFQREWLHSYDLELPPGQVPRNQDGEVADFQLLPLAEALALAAGEAMTVDAALVTLDFAARHGLLHEPQREPILRALAGLRLPHHGF